MGEDFNKKILRGARVIRVKDAIENSIMTLESQLPFHEEMENHDSLKFLRGKMEGLKLALEILNQEFNK